MALLPSPTEGESLEQYLQRFSDDEIRQIHSNAERLRNFSSLLLTQFRAFERREDNLEHLWRIVERLNNLDSILYFIQRLKPVRLELLEYLARNEREIQRMSTFCTLGRLVGSTVDIVSTFSGLFLRDTNTRYANLAFRLATSFGFLGLASTLSEMNILKNTLDDLMRLIRRDQELFAPIERWYHQSNELEEAMQDVFPFDVTNHIMAEFGDSRSTENAQVRLLSALIRSIAEQDLERIRDGGLVQNLINFSLYPASEDWVEWIIIRRHPVILDIARIILQLHSSPLRFALSQSIPALAMADQNIESFAVWGRVALNLVTISDSIMSLRKTEPVADEMRHLYRHYDSEMAALQRIAEFIGLRRRRL